MLAFSCYGLAISVSGSISGGVSVGVGIDVGVSLSVGVSVSVGSLVSVSVGVSGSGRGKFYCLSGCVTLLVIFLLATLFLFLLGWRDVRLNSSY